ncbi:MAG: formyltransferase family protein [Steroidobacteraceae bacterium]
MNRPIRVVQFSGRYLDPPALQFALLLDAHPEIDLVGVLCEAAGSGWRFRLGELWRRRGLLGVSVLARDLSSAAIRFLHGPAEAVSRHAEAKRLSAKITTVPEMHAAEVLECVRQWRPDLGAIYGAPVLRPALFEIPALGTFGIHHGRVPHYRGRKTTFWEIYNGEPTAGVTIQRVDAGIDTGDVVKSGEVTIGAKGYGRVERETQELGFELYVEAILEASRGCARFARQGAAPRGRHYRQPSVADFIKLWVRVAGRRLGLRST